MLLFQFIPAIMSDTVLTRISGLSLLLFVFEVYLPMLQKWRLHNELLLCIKPFDEDECIKKKLKIIIKMY